MSHRHSNFNITSHDEDITLNTPILYDLYNIENGDEEIRCNWNDTLVSSHIPTNALAEFATGPSQDETPTTDTNGSASRIPFDLEDTIVQSAEQESCGGQSLITSTIENEDPQESSAPELTVEELLTSGIVCEHIIESSSIESDDGDASIIIDMPTMVNEGTRLSEDSSSISINNLYVQLSSSSSSSSLSNERGQQTVADTEILSSSNVVPTAYFRHPIASKNRTRYKRELATNEMSAKMSQIKDYFSEHPLYVGPHTLFMNGFVEISVLSMTPEGRFIYSPHKLYRPNMLDEEKFCNPIYFQHNQLEIENGYLKVDLQLARTRQGDFPQQESVAGVRSHWSRTSTFKIKHYLSGKEESVEMTARQFNKKYYLDTMFIAIRQVHLQPDGITYQAQPNAPIVVSNRFVGTDSDDSPSNWDFESYKLNITQFQIAKRDISTEKNDNCTVEFTIQIPELYHCTLKSRTKELEVKLITDGQLSDIYKIIVEETPQNPVHLPVLNDLINIRLPILKKIGSRQHPIWLELLSAEGDHTGYGYFQLEICLQDVNMTERKTYSYSSIQSVELVDIGLSANTKQMICSEENHLQEHAVIESQTTDKRRYDETEENLNETLPVAKFAKTTQE